MMIFQMSSPIIQEPLPPMTHQIIVKPTVDNHPHKNDGEFATPFSWGISTKFLRFRVVSFPSEKKEEIQLRLEREREREATCVSSCWGCCAAVAQPVCRDGLFTWN
jgi:hypothetical protein